MRKRKLTVCPAYGARSTTERKYASGSPHQASRPPSGLLYVVLTGPSYGSVSNPVVTWVQVAPPSLDTSRIAPSKHPPALLSIDCWFQNRNVRFDRSLGNTISGDTSHWSLTPAKLLACQAWVPLLAVEPSAQLSVPA